MKTSIPIHLKTNFPITSVSKPYNTKRISTKHTANLLESQMASPFFSTPSSTDLQQCTVTVIRFSKGPFTSAIWFSGHWHVLGLEEGVSVEGLLPSGSRHQIVEEKHSSPV